MHDIAPRQRSSVLRLLGYGLAIVCLVWLLHDFHVVRALHDMANADWRWVVLGIGFDVLSYGVQALRWKLLLTPFGRIRLRSAIRAVFAGLFANLVFPLRPGEFLRSYLISDSENISLGRVLVSVGVERLVDLVIATASLAVVSLFVEDRMPRRFKHVADTMGIVTLIVLAIVVLLILYLELKLSSKVDPEPVDAEPETGPPSLREKALAVLLGLHAMGTAPSFYPAVLTSLLMPLCQTLALWCMMRSYGLGLSFLSAAVVLLVINLGVSLPNAPANVGSYQFFCVLGLSVFQVEKTTATGFSIFAFLALTLPFVFLGFAALLRSGLSFRSLRERVTGLPQQAVDVRAQS
ncbi:MAG: lysylphosphatidylglycerol synthase transmembrane domain-containing protein [Candidatus Acidiferrales bacterium]